MLSLGVLVLVLSLEELGVLAFSLGMLALVLYLGELVLALSLGVLVRSLSLGMLLRTLSSCLLLRPKWARGPMKFARVSDPSPPHARSFKVERSRSRRCPRAKGRCRGGRPVGCSKV